MAIPKRHINDEMLRHLEISKRAHLAPELMVGAAGAHHGPLLRRHEGALCRGGQAGHHLHVRGPQRLV